MGLYLGGTTRAWRHPSGLIKVTPPWDFTACFGSSRMSPHKHTFLSPHIHPPRLPPGDGALNPGWTTFSLSCSASPEHVGEVSPRFHSSRPPSPPCAGGSCWMRSTSPPARCLSASPASSSAVAPAASRWWSGETRLRCGGNDAVRRGQQPLSALLSFCSMYRCMHASQNQSCTEVNDDMTSRKFSRRSSYRQATPVRMIASG